ALGNLGTALLRLKRLDEAIDAYRKLLRIDPKSVPAHVNLGLALHSQAKAQRDRKKLHEACAAYRKAVELDPKCVIAHFSLGVLLCDELSEYDNAIECFRTVIKLDPKHA